MIKRIVVRPDATIETLEKFLKWADKKEFFLLDLEQIDILFDVIDKAYKNAVHFDKNRD